MTINREPRKNNKWCDILEGFHSYPNIHSSVQPPRQQTSTTQPSREQINEPTKELSSRVSIKRTPVIPLKRSLVSQEWKTFEAYSSEEDSEDSKQSEGSEQYESEDSEIEPALHTRGKGRPGFYHS